jgi:hypothetical protein
VEILWRVGRSTAGPLRHVGVGAQTGWVVVVIGILLALLVAGLVLLVASASSGGSVHASPWRSFRAGWAARGSHDVVDEVPPVDLRLMEFLAVTSDEGDGYLHVEELGEGLQHARDKAVRVLPGARRA